jgi:hypothetical protein
VRGEPHPGGNAFEEEEVVGKEVRRGGFVSVLRRLTRTPTVHRSNARTVNQLLLKPLNIGAARPPCAFPRLAFSFSPLYGTSGMLLAMSYRSAARILPSI